MKFNQLRWVYKPEFQRSRSQALVLKGIEVYLVRRHDEVGTNKEYYIYAVDTNRHIHEGLSLFELVGVLARARPLDEVQ